MTPCSAPTATLEELLRQVIEAQVKGGCDRFRTDDDVKITINDEGEATFQLRGVRIVMCGEAGCQRHVLQILLDTDGCRAAYQTMYPASDHILFAWHAGKGNNVRAALETAVSFLPK